MKLTLPWPPSVNTYWRRAGHTIYLSNKGRKYRQDAYYSILPYVTTPFTGPVSVRVNLYPPDKRVRDIDNVFKGLLDSLVYGGVMGNDNQIKHLEAFMHEKDKPGRAEVEVTAL
jgi:crossover junction endodeoxyribonuclease RusA